MVKKSTLSKLQPPVAGQSTLSDSSILKHMKNGTIIITPFKRENLSTSSYDLSLGEWYYEEQNPEPGFTIYSPYSKTDVERIWGKPKKAEKAKEYAKKIGIDIPEGISPNDQIILIPPGSTILSHTEEFIGGREIVTTMMKARSTLGRNFIEVCKCAGWGDVGYVNRWTMEITNNSTHYTIPLVVGRRIAQLIFFETDPIQGKDYVKTGKYNPFDNVEKLKKAWKSDWMLPKMYLDREVRKK